ncbi:hypothetical protein [Marinirhabdus gelatinilytica]|uniref:Uncharacterized protein n=1 Tax=Marinirhabdus gelatinilytica TaxID=1703343 RepID=A0A370QBE0_9FLAO|nr:hypothetical protein [Marinirhabdus gelatinilytica]RDK85599.1 hypothetical protein C8D94_103426 [Marinirhabdus gelatinilytica]
MKYKLLFFIALLMSSCNDGIKHQHPSKDLSTEAKKNPSVQEFLNPAEIDKSHLPRLFSNGKQLYMSWVTSEKDTDFLNYSVYNGTIWNKTETITQGTDWFTNWADFPVICENNGNILTTYLQKSDTATYAYDIRYNSYNSETKTWHKNLLLNTDGTKTEHGFVSAVPVPGGFEVAWLDGRNTGGSHENHDKQGAGGAMTLRSAIITNDGEVLNEVQLDNRVCDCCQTSIANSGRMTRIAYRDRSETEIRDISVATKAVTGHLEKSIKKVHADTWKIAGCPVNGPSIDAFGNSFVTAWFTAADGEGKIKVSFLESDIQQPFRIDNGNATGRVDVEMISETDALVLWMEPKGESEVIMLAEVSISEGKTKEVQIFETTPDRASGFPQLEVMEETAYVAWTDVEGKEKTVRTVAINLKDIE